MKQIIKYSSEDACFIVNNLIKIDTENIEKLIPFQNLEN
jgi:hypothetical protein